jgi:protein gp37
MGDATGISWTDHSFNPWWGFSPGCRSCYADVLARRWGMTDLWHRDGPRRMLSDATWARPLRWNREAAAAGKPARVFCASMAGVFEPHPDVVEARARLWDLIEATPWLRWQLLTKRPENVAGMVPWGAAWPANVWLGTSAEDQRRAGERIPALAAAGGPAVRFVSAEPLLGPVDLGPWLARLDWVITGGESGGAKRREMSISWLESGAGQCRAAGVPVFVKQDSGPRPGMQGRIPDATWALRQFPAEAAHHAR